jgi:hypothetical protein
MASRWLSTSALALFAMACSGARTTSTLAYAGDPEATIPALEAEIAAEGFKPICKEEAFCRFDLDETLRVHFKATSKGLVLIVDVLDGKELPPAELEERRAAGEKRAREIWKRAEKRALRDEESARVAAREKAEREAAAEAAEEKSGNKPNPAALLDMLDSVQARTSQGRASGGDAGATGEVTASARCCINGAYYSCPDAAALNQCGGETAACLIGCQSSSASSSCEDKCLAEHAPNPKACTREMSKDSECAR